MENMIWLIPIVAIAGGFAVEIVKMVLKHQERAMMIQRGMHPDAPRPAPEKPVRQ